MTVPTKTPLLDRVNVPEDLRKLPRNELRASSPTSCAGR